MGTDFGDIEGALVTAASRLRHHLPYSRIFLDSWGYTDSAAILFASFLQDLQGATSEFGKASRNIMGM